MKGLPRVIAGIVLLVLLSAVGAVATAFLHPRAPSWAASKLSDGEITVETLPRDTPLIWIDARSRAAYSAGHLDGAILLNEDEWNVLLEDLLMRWQGGETLIVYCDGGQCHASKAVASRLKDELGMENVYHLQGGWDALVEAGMVEDVK